MRKTLIAEGLTPFQGSKVAKTYAFLRVACRKHHKNSGELLFVEDLVQKTKQNAGILERPRPKVVKTRVFLRVSYKNARKNTRKSPG